MLFCEKILLSQSCCHQRQLLPYSCTSGGTAKRNFSGDLLTSYVEQLSGVDSRLFITLPLGLESESLTGDR